MRTGSSKRRKPRRPDVNEVAFATVLQATNGGAPKNRHAVAMGKLGGKKGGLARRDALSPEQRSEIAAKAARARWSRKAT
jgi:hypothetical protein